jgi:hypothetical protein
VNIDSESPARRAGHPLFFTLISGVAVVLTRFGKSRALRARCIAAIGWGGAIVVAAKTTARMQEVHIPSGHMLCGLVEKGLGLA